MAASPRAADTSITWLGTAHGHTLLRYGTSCYAVPFELGSWDITSKALRANPRVLAASSPDAVERLVKAAGPLATVRPADRAAPMATGLSGFDVYRCQSRCFAVPEGEVFNTDRLRARRYERFLFGHTLQDVQDEIVRRTTSQAPRVLLLANPSAGVCENSITRLGGMQITVLTNTAVPALPSGVDVIRHEVDLRDVETTPGRSRLVSELREKEFDCVVIPYPATEWWVETGLERFASSVCNRLLLLFGNGTERFYRGEDIRRVVYHKAYLRSMFRHLPPFRGTRVLEVGASDGLACDLVALDEPEHLVGVDVVDIVGCGYPNALVSYRTIDDESLPFDDNSFDVTFSIATLEHVRNPSTAIQEMIRVTRPGGHCYIQAGPLYFSPYGHHMFGYFDDAPWIHLRMSPAEIVDEACRRRVDETIERDHGESVERYVHRMLDANHINGRTWDEYGLEALTSQSAVRVVELRQSDEGNELVTPDILREVYPIARRDLVAHGFELVLEKI